MHNPISMFGSKMTPTLILISTTQAEIEQLCQRGLALSQSGDDRDALESFLEGHRRDGVAKDVDSRIRPGPCRVP